MADAEVDRDVERHPSWSDRSLPAPALTRQAAGGRNPGSGEGREGNPKFATNGTRSGVKTGGWAELDRRGYGGYSGREGHRELGHELWMRREELRELIEGAERADLELIHWVRQEGRLEFMSDDELDDLEYELWIRRKELSKLRE